MKTYNSCKEAIDVCSRTQTFAMAHLYSDEKPMNMHIHDSYELYFSISGGKQFLIDNRFYSIHPGDLFFINQYESHHLTQIDSQVHERIVLSIYPDYLKGFCTETTDLDYCFSSHSSLSGHKLSLSEEEQKRFLYYIHKLSSISGYGEDILERAAFLELMVFLNKCFLKGSKRESSTEEKTEPYHAQVDQILTYIDQHIQNPLTIEELSENFFLSASYLCRIFKSATGTTINKYITAKRITLAKSLLSEGHTVNETCELCGFNDYSNFLKAFSRAVGISPKKYAQFTA
ncbi:MAG: AraC family transcriptional regulator [Candidatus Limivivens sp.]|nr:AraC family transcriptional regulator [Candidatus Limivivens sp.]